jgi:hypothetical protein
MGKIVAIGGGENGHHNTKYETGPFDKEIIKLTGKTSPDFLFIGLANSYPNYYFLKLWTKYITECMAVAPII